MVDSLSLLIQKVHPDAVIPTRGSFSAAGLDLTAVIGNRLDPSERKLIRTGLSMAIPHGFYGRIAPRSGLALKHGIDVMAGVIDSDYRGELQVLLVNLSTQPFIIKPGDRIAQLVIEAIHLPEIVEVADLETTDRGAGGFGSTGL